MAIQYPPNNSKRVYSVQEDRFLLISVNKFGLLSENLYEKVKAEIRKSEHFKFDWFFLSRTPQELSRRANTLLLAVTREFEGPDALRRKKTKGHLDNNNTGTATPMNLSRQGTVEPTDLAMKRASDPLESEQLKKTKV